MPQNRLGGFCGDGRPANGTACLDVNIRKISIGSLLVAAIWLATATVSSLAQEQSLSTPGDLLTALDSSDSVAQVAAAESFVDVAVQSDMDEVLPVLERAITHPQPDVRYYAIVGLAGSAMASIENAKLLEQAVPVLVARFGDEDPRVRAVAADTISAVYPWPSKEVVDPLIALLSDPDPTVVRATLGTLTRVRPKAIGANDKLVKLISESDGTLKGYAINALGDLNHDEHVIDPKVVSALTNALSDANEFVRWQAVNSLGRFGSQAYYALPDLEAMAKDPSEDKGVRRGARQALVNIKGEVPVLHTVEPGSPPRPAGSSPP